MKPLLLSFLLASTAIHGSAADTAPLSGKWQVHTSVAGREGDYSCTFTQQDADLTGECHPEQTTVQISGKVQGKNASWMYKSQYEGSPLTVTFKGTIESAAKIKGIVTAEEYGVSGDFTAVQAK